jgi:hypothetical protein
MAEGKKDDVAPDRDKRATELDTTLQQPRQLSNGSQPNFESPAQLESWFDAQLMQVYSEVVSEPLPKEFVELLQKLREKNAQ